MDMDRFKQPLMLHQDSATSIDTPACMRLEAKRKMMLGNRLMIANKVELISLIDINATDCPASLKRTSSNSSLSIASAQNHATSRGLKDFELNKSEKAASTSLSSILYHSLEETSSKSSLQSDLSVKMSASSSTSSTNGYTFIDPNKIHLFVKAGQDGRSQGACPFCQDVFMQLLIKAQTNKFNFDVITINLDNPPKEFKELSIKPPVLIHGSSSMSTDYTDGSNAVILSDVDEIAEYLDRLYPNSELMLENTIAKKVSLNVFSKFSFFIRDVSSKSTNLEMELEKIDHYLKMNTDDDNKFLNGRTLTGLDCSLLPKLQHIRVAAENIKSFNIPLRFTYLWRYIRNAYQTDAFQKSCPPDREIIWHWLKSNHSTKDLFTIMQETPYKSLSIPDELKLLN